MLIFDLSKIKQQLTLEFTEASHGFLVQQHHSCFVLKNVLTAIELPKDMLVTLVITIPNTASLAYCMCLEKIIIYDYNRDNSAWQVGCEIAIDSDKVYTEIAVLQSKLSTDAVQRMRYLLK